MKARVVLADAHDAYRQGLARALRDDPRFELVAEASDGAEAVEAARSLRPQLVVMDVRLSVLDGFAACEQLAGDTCVVLLSDYVGDALRARAAEVGAAALLDKSCSRAELCDGLEKLTNDVR